MSTGYLAAFGVPASAATLSTVGATIFIGIPAYAVLRNIRLPKRAPRQPRKKAAKKAAPAPLPVPDEDVEDTTVKGFEEDVIFLHQKPREENIPTDDMFALKAETFLLFAEATYDNDFVDAANPPARKKLPFYSYNGKIFSDTHEGSELLAKAAQTKWIEDGLDAATQARGMAFRVLVEEHAWPLLMRERHPELAAKGVVTPVVAAPAPKRKPKAAEVDASKLPGVVRELLEFFFPDSLTPEEDDEDDEEVAPPPRPPRTKGDAVELERVLDALSGHLSHHMWILGTEEPTMADASLFALVANAVYFKDQAPNFASGIMQRENLHNHFRRIREMHWSQWDPTDAPEEAFKKLQEIIKTTVGPTDADIAKLRQLKSIQEMANRKA